MLTQEERKTICLLLRRETACGMMTASDAVVQLIKVLKQHPKIVMDKPSNLKIAWEDYE